MGPAHDLAELSDHDLLAGGVADGVAEARANAARWGRLVEFHSRREADYQARTALSPRFTLTPRADTVTEVSALWGLSEPRVRHELNVALFLHQYFAEVWALCAAGQLDGYRATLLADAVRHAVTDPLQLRILAPRLTGFLHKHLSDAHGLEGVPAVVVCTPKQLRNKLTYEINRLRSADAEERHRRAKADRTVRATETTDGMAHLGITATVDQVLLAEHRLTHAARRLRRAGDERTLTQLKSDLALDLLIGRSQGVPAPAYARPVVNLTVPVQTVMGLSDDPGVLAGGTVVPAGLARAIAADPDATWHRMLTDPAGRMVELSTTSYKPTGPIWRHVVAQWTTCYEPACDRSAAQVEIDHRTPYPRGATTPGNLWPACKRGHTAKHAPGFTIEQHTTGSYRLRTAAGFTHQIAPPAKPVNAEWPDLPDLTDEAIQFTATELLSTLRENRNHHDQERAEAHELEWEHGYRLDQLKL
ncbi:hypothetical protein ACT8ZV_15915 [Nocardioides sp. MAHUQ-72]|uniref:HNH endonuclease signature motif containing protein n=1 Tax=unclassified Nocardioides TaxID=2615069 RepID=UPI0036195DD5